MVFTYEGVMWVAKLHGTSHCARLHPWSGRAHASSTLQPSCWQHDWHWRGAGEHQGSTSAALWTLCREIFAKGGWYRPEGVGPCTGPHAASLSNITHAGHQVGDYPFSKRVQ